MHDKVYFGMAFDIPRHCCPGKYDDFGDAVIVEAAVDCFPSGTAGCASHDNLHLFARPTELGGVKAEWLEPDASYVVKFFLSVPEPHRGAKHV